jgi:hypothetical protein
LALMAAVVAAPVAIAASSPASAVCVRKCTDILPSGTCSRYGSCEEVLESVGTFRPVRSAKDCRRSQVLRCDYNSCDLVCSANKK